MAKYAISFALVFSLFILSSHASSPVNIDAKTDANVDVTVTSSKSDNGLQLLPSENQNQEVKTITVDDELLPETDTTTVESVGISIPLIRLRPINHHFHHQRTMQHDDRPFWFRFNHHRCNHHQHEPRSQISEGERWYGHDGLVSDRRVNDGDLLIRNQLEDRVLSDRRFPVRLNRDELTQWHRKRGHVEIGGKAFIGHEEGDKEISYGNDMIYRDDRSRFSGGHPHPHHFRVRRFGNVEEEGGFQKFVNRH